MQRNLLAAFGAIVMTLTLLTGPALADDYHLGPGDVITISVYGNQRLDTDARIDADGSINYPFLGSVKLAGLTTAQAASKIADGLRAAQILKNPEVTVRVKEFQSKRIAVLGQVQKPGEYFLSSDKTLVDMLGQAGWVTPKAADYIVLTRTQPNGERKDYRLTLDQITTGKFKNVKAQPGDVIYVPQEQTFYILGAVNSPGSYRYEPGMTVIQALSIGGGLTPRGDYDRVVIKRKDASGKQITKDADFDTKIQPGDVIFVKERIF